MFCTSCGTKLTDDLAFCTNCGVKINDDTTQNTPKRSTTATSSTFNHTVKSINDAIKTSTSNIDLKKESDSFLSFFKTNIKKPLDIVESAPISLVSSIASIAIASFIMGILSALCYGSGSLLSGVKILAVSSFGVFIFFIGLPSLLFLILTKVKKESISLEKLLSISVIATIYEIAFLMLMLISKVLGNVIYDIFYYMSFLTLILIFFSNLIKITKEHMLVFITLPIVISICWVIRSSVLSILRMSSYFNYNIFD